MGHTQLAKLAMFQVGRVVHVDQLQAHLPQVVWAVSVWHVANWGEVRQYSDR